MQNLPSFAEQVASKKRLNGLFRNYSRAEPEIKPRKIETRAYYSKLKVPFVVDPWAPRCRWPRTPEDAARDASIQSARTIKIIVLIVARYFNISAAEIYDHVRTQHIVRPRQIAMYMAREFTKKSLPEIGRRFNNRDHTTVLHALRRIDELMACDTTIKQDVEAIRVLISLREQG